MGNSRVQRGFRRVALVIAVPALILAGCALFGAGVAWLITPEGGNCVHLEGLDFYRCADEAATAARRLDIFLSVGLAALAIGVVWFASWRALGWVIEGFSAD